MALAPRGAAAGVRWCTKTVEGSEAADACCRKRIAVTKGPAAVRAAARERCRAHRAAAARWELRLTS
eukprot:3694302-Alexandrium_andersonii.AAC.1